MKAKEEKPTDKIPTETIKLFSWDYLEKSPKVQAIIKKYFGEIKVKLFMGDERELCIDGCYCEHDLVRKIIREINQIPPTELIKTRYSAKTLIEASVYFYDQPYWFLFKDRFSTDSKDLELASMLLTGITSESVTSPVNWQDAQTLLCTLDKRLYCADEETIEYGEKALTSYQAKYAMNKLGQHGVRKLFKRLFNFSQLESNASNFIKRLNEALGEDIQEVFSNQTPVYVGVDDLDKFNAFFEYPRWIEFTPEANDEIIHRILRDEMTSTQIDFYLGAEHQTTELYKLYPALKHIIKTTTSAHSFWKAGDILYIIWRLLPDKDKRLDKWLNDELYDMFWSRIGDIDQIKSYEYLGLLYDKKQIFDDALGWIVNNPNLKIRNPRLWSYLEELAESENRSYLEITLPTVLGRVCVIRYQDLSPADQYRLVSKYFWGKKFYEFFSRPKTIEETKDYLKICRDDYKIIPALEVLLAEYHSPEIQDYIYQYIIDNFEQIYAPGGISDVENILKMFEAACSGATTHTKLRDELKLKCVDFVGNIYDFSNRIEKAIEYANHNINYRELQTQLLVKNLRRYAEK